MTDDEWYDRHRLDDIKPTDPGYEWLKAIAEVSVMGQPCEDTSNSELPMLFEPEPGGRFT